MDDSEAEHTFKILIGGAVASETTFTDKLSQIVGALSLLPYTEYMPILFSTATDCHLGFAEKDQIRGNDSLNTFKEILQIGKEHQVLLYMNIDTTAVCM